MTKILDPEVEQSTEVPVRRWYATLFLLDMWERFGFYGLQAILVLYAVAPRSDGGLGLPAGDAAALFGAWLGFTFMLSLPGGWIGDRILGPRRAVLVGTVIIVFGHVCLSVPSPWLAPVGLLLLSAGIGLYKPNHQAMINLVLGRDTGRRESGISLMYVGIQVSALLAPLIVGFLGEQVNWQLGFAAGAVAMIIGALQFGYMSRHVSGAAGRPGRPASAEERRTVARRTGVTVLAVLALLAAAAVTGTLNPTTAIITIGMLSLVAPVVGYVTLYRHRSLTGVDRSRLQGFLWVFLGSALFWMLIGQGGSVLNLFARDQTNRQLGDFTVPASWLQSATPLFILVMAPFIAWLLPRASSLMGLPGKFSTGLLLAGVSFLLMAVAAMLAANGTKVSVWWLMAVYFMHACGEIIIAAVGIAAAADVLPPAFVSHTLGLLWLFAALGGGLGSQVVRLIDVMPDAAYYAGTGVVATVVGLLFAARRHAIGARLAPRS